jgi:hypothetical protein
MRVSCKEKALKFTLFLLKIKELEEPLYFLKKVICKNALDIDFVSQ